MGNTDRHKANDTTRQALSNVMKLIEDGDLVRNIENDGDVMKFMKQGLRIALALKQAENALGSPVSESIVSDTLHLSTK